MGWRPRFKTFKKNLFFSLVVFILLLLCFELVLSVGGYFYFYVYSNLDRPKIEEDTFRILFLGESTTEGVSVGRENSYPAQLEKIFQQNYLNKKIRCYNKGRGAIETTAILRNLDKNMIKYKPQLVIMMAGMNDRFFTNNKSISRLESFCLRFKLYRFLVCLKDYPRLQGFFNSGKWYINSVYNDDIFAYEGRPGYYYHQEPVSKTIFNFNSIIQKVHSYNSEIWLVGYFHPGAKETCNPLLQKIAEENNINYVGDYPEVDLVNNRSLFDEDNFHLTKEGYKIVAETVAEKIVNEGIIDGLNG